MKIGILKYMSILWTGYMWGRCISSLYILVNDPDEWPFFLCYAFFSIFFTVMDIIEIRTAEKELFDAERRKEN